MITSHQASQRMSLKPIHLATFFKNYPSNRMTPLQDLYDNPEFAYY